MTDMHTIIGGLKLGFCWGVGIVTGTLADAIQTPLGHETHVTLGAAVGVGVSCLLAAMWLSRRLTQLQDGQKSLERSQARLEEAFNKLPCHAWTETDCKVPVKKKP